MSGFPALFSCHKTGKCWERSFDFMEIYGKDVTNSWGALSVFCPTDAL